MNITPTQNNPLTYLVHEHQPIQEWSVEPGERCGDIEINDKSILVDMYLSSEDAKNHGSWDRSKKRVMVGVKGPDGRCIYECAVYESHFDKELTIGLRLT